jgi:hypothetical protein
LAFSITSTVAALQLASLFDLLLSALGQCTA